MGHAKTQQRLQARELERRAWELCVVREMSQYEAAQELGVTQSAVSKAIKRLEQQVIAENRGRVMAQKVRQSAKLDHVYREALKSWEKSKQLAIKRRKTTKGTGPSADEQAMVEQKEQSGDARFLAEARGALSDQRKLWGLDAPTKIQQVDPHRPHAEMSTADLLDAVKSLSDGKHDVAAAMALAVAETQGEH